MSLPPGIAPGSMGWYLVPLAIVVRGAPFVPVDRRPVDRVDVVVIGAGIAGAGAAWALAADRRVVLLEREAEAGHHATGRSAAVLSETSGEFEVCALAALSRPYLERPPWSEGRGSTPGLLTPRGLLWVADRAKRHRLDPLAEVAARVGVPHRLVSGPDARRLMPELRPGWVEAALFEPEARSIDVAGLLAGFLSGFRARGGELRRWSEALELRPGPPGWTVAATTREGAVVEIGCDVVVDAAGGWADEVAMRAGVEPLGLRPLRRTAFVFPAADGVDVSGRPLVMDVGGGFYVEPEGPGWLASPADETPSEPVDARPDELAMAQAVDALAQATTIEVRGVRRAWAGLRTFAPDRRPVVGFDPAAPGFFWLAGQGGAGIKTAPALARLTRDLVVDGRPRPEFDDAGLDPARLAPTRFRPAHRHPAPGRA